MPLLSLAKTLAFRKFVVVLQQTLVDLGAHDDGQVIAKPGKRKRDATIKYELEHLKTTKSRLQAAEAIFNALRALLQRLEAVASHDRIGAEHVRSLFCTSATDMIKIVNPMFAICKVALTAGDIGDLDNSEEWISIITSIWDLHLQGDGDAAEVAAHLLGDVLPLVRDLDGIGDGVHVPDPTERRWSSDVHAFLQRTITQPAKASFVSQQSQAILAIVLDINSKRIGAVVPALYHVLSASSISSEVRRRKGETDWMENTFQVIEEAVRPLDHCEELLKALLQRATERSMPVQVEHLRLICWKYALQETTRWDILALAVACDADIFQVTGTGKELLAAVCDKMLTELEAAGQIYADIARVVDGIFQGYCTSRDLPGFLKLWYSQMCRVEDVSPSLHSPWFHLGQSSDENSLIASIEQYVLPQQLLDVLDWVVASGVHQQALDVFLAGVSQGVKSDSFADAVGDKIYQVSKLADDSKSKSWASALRWRTVSRMLAWFPSDKRTETWTAAHKTLSKVLKKDDIETANCFEAFKCCCQAWSSMSPDDPLILEPHTMLQAFSSRFATRISGKDISIISNTEDLPKTLEYDISEGPSLHQYVAWYSRGPSRLAHLSIGEKDSAPVIAEVASKVPLKSRSALPIWEALTDNDQLWQSPSKAAEFIGHLITALKRSTSGETAPFPGSREWLQLLSHVPSIAFTRQQREQAVAILMGPEQSPPAEDSEDADLDDWKTYLSLLTKLTARPTFYEGMHFEDITRVADRLGRHVTRGKQHDAVFLEMIERTTRVAATIFKQMSENIDERNMAYLNEGRALLSTVAGQISTLEKKSAGIDSLPLRLTLMKSLAVQLSQSATCRGNETLLELRTKFQGLVSELIVALISKWVTSNSSRPDHGMVLALYAAVDAAHALDADMELTPLKSSKVQELDEMSYDGMMAGELRGWTIQIFLRTYHSASVTKPLDSVLPPLDKIPSELRESVMARMVEAILKEYSLEKKFEYATSLIANISTGAQGRHGQAMAIDKVVRNMLGKQFCFRIIWDDTNRCTEDETSGVPANSAVFAMLYGELIRCLPHITDRTDASRLCSVLQQLLERSPRPLGQWNIELTLEELCDLSSTRNNDAALPFAGLCKIVETVIKKHRLRLEGHYHLLTTLLQALLCKLIVAAKDAEDKGAKAQTALAHAYARVLTLICEPTAGAVSRGPQQGSLSSATDAAKRSAGKHMYLVLMQYVKLQLEGGVPRPVQEALEPAMNSIFDITSAESRKILNDAMNASGRAILREMFKRYTKFGKWSGV
jgi:nucleolar pre-ribosomal-associated protein 2